MDAKKLKTIFIYCGVGIVILGGVFFLGYWRGNTISHESYSKRLHELDAKYSSQSAVLASDLAKAEERAGNAEIARANIEKQLSRSIQTGRDMAGTITNITRTSGAIMESTRNFTGIVNSILTEQSGTSETDTTIDGIIEQLTIGLGELDGYIQRLQTSK